MPGTMTLSALMTAARQRADMLPASYTATLTGNTNNFVTDSELISYINQSAFELYDILVQKFGNDYFATSTTVTTDGTNTLFALPTDFYKLLGCDLYIASSQSIYVPLKRFNFASRTSNYYSGGVPQAGLVVRVWYVPRFTELAALSTTLDGVSGWTEYVIVDAAIKMKDKEESDPSVLMAQKQALLQRIEAAAENRDAGSPCTVADVRSQGLGFPYGMAYLAAVNNLRYRLQGDKLWLENGVLDSNQMGFVGGCY